MRLFLPETLVIVGPVFLNDQALTNQKLQGLMPHKKVLHFLLVALLLLYGLSLVSLGHLIVGALLNLLAFHLLRVLFAGLLEDRALELQLLVSLSFLC